MKKSKLKTYTCMHCSKPLSKEEEDEYDCVACADCVYKGLGYMTPYRSETVIEALDRIAEALENLNR